MRGAVLCPVASDIVTYVAVLRNFDSSCVNFYRIFVFNGKPSIQIVVYCIEFHSYTSLLVTKSSLYHQNSWDLTLKNHEKYIDVLLHTMLYVIIINVSQNCSDLYYIQVLFELFIISESLIILLFSANLYPWLSWHSVCHSRLWVNLKSLGSIPTLSQVERIWLMNSPYLTSCSH